MVAKICWLQSILDELHVPLHLPMEIFCDNISATYFSINSIKHTITNHLEVDLHFVPELVLWGDIVVLYISEDKQIVDIFTKGLSSSRFKLLCNNLCVVSHAQI